MNEITENDVISGQILTHSGSQTAVLNIGKTQTLAFLKDPSTLAALYDDNKELRVLTTKGNFLSWEITFKASTPDPYVPGPTTTTIKWRLDIYFKKTFLTSPSLKLIDYVDQFFQIAFNHLEENMTIQEIKVGSDRIEIYVEEVRANPLPLYAVIGIAIAAVLLTLGILCLGYKIVNLLESKVEAQTIREKAELAEDLATMGFSASEIATILGGVDPNKTDYGDVAILIAVILAAAFVGYGVLSKKR